MRYWAYFAAKLVATCATFYGLHASAELVLAAGAALLEFPSYVPPRFGYNLGYTLAVLVLFLLLRRRAVLGRSGTSATAAAFACGACACRWKPVPGAGCCNSAGRGSNTSARTATAR